MKRLTNRQRDLLSDNYLLIEKFYKHFLKKSHRNMEEDLLSALHMIAMSAASRYDKSKGAFDKFLSGSLYYGLLCAARTYQRENQVIGYGGIDEDDHMPQIADPKVMGALASLEAIEDFKNHIKNCMEPHEQVVLLSTLENYTHAETSKLAGIPMGSVHKTLFQARRKLDRYLQEILTTEDTND